MPIPEITLAQFNKIASGKYNAGFVDFKTDAQGNAINELAKVDSHVHSTSKNNVLLTPERVVEVKEAFIAALKRAAVPDDRIAEIRKTLGIPESMAATGDRGKMKEFLTTRFKPLTRQHVRTLLDKYAAGGVGYTAESLAAVSPKDFEAARKTAAMTGSRRDARREVNIAARENAKGNVDYKITDVVSLLSGTRSLDEFKNIILRRIKGQGPEADGLRAAQAAKLSASFAALFAEVHRMATTDIQESAEIEVMGAAVKLAKGPDGKLLAAVGSGAGKITVEVGRTADMLLAALIGNAVNFRNAIGASTVKSLLTSVFAADVKKGLRASDRTSLSRNFACVVLQLVNGGIADRNMPILDLSKYDYNTGCLVEMAKRALDGVFAGENILDTKEKLDNYYGNLRKDTANLPPEIKSLLEGVADMPIEWLEEKGSFIVRAPIVADINENVAAIPPAPPHPPWLPQDVTMVDVKDFVADIVFSNDTMVSDVVVDQPGEQLRKTLADGKRTAALAAIIKDPAVLDTAAAPEIAGVLKEGFAAIKTKLDEAWRAAHDGQTIDQAAQGKTFVFKFSEFLRNAEALPGEAIAEFDDIIDTMTDRAAAKIQTFINGVFKINEQNGANVVTNPYKDMSPEEIKAQLDAKSLNDIIDSAATSDVPGQTGFFKQVISTYFSSLERSDKRSCLAAALKFAVPYEFGNLQGEELASAQKVAINKFTGAILKGASPLLHKMMQGLPKEIVGEYADALEDMKSSLAPIPRKIVQGYLNKIIADSNGKIKSIKLEKSLGAASVGEAFLCQFEIKTRKPKMRQMTRDEQRAYKDAHPNERVPNWTPVLVDGQQVMEDKIDTKSLVVKIMRHDAERRVKREAEIFTAAAQKIPGMAKTWEGQLRQYMTEFDFTGEAQNVTEGYALYGIMDNAQHKLQAIAPEVTSMKMSDLVAPTKNIMVAECEPGQTVDKFFKKNIEELRLASSAVFERDPATGRVKWTEKVDPESGETVNVPVLKQNIPALAVTRLKEILVNKYDNLAKASNKIQQAAKAWFYNALMGDGKFHGDTHAGNFMITNNQIAFIDFGNLYKLEKQRADGVNEQTELMRVILGAAFRNKQFVLEGFEKLMSPEGKTALAENRAKAEAILDSVLAPGRGLFSFNIVYRLQAAVVELQKLGMELPPQINCFIQSMVRLSNMVTEMNTIINQGNAMLAEVRNLTRPPQQRDELDLVGKAFDSMVSDEGRRLVPADPGDITEMDDNIPAYKQLLKSPEYGGPQQKILSQRFRPGGEYHEQVKTRLTGAPDAVAEAESLARTLREHCDAEHVVSSQAVVERLDAALQKFRTDFAAARTQEAKAAAIEEFATVFANCEVVSISNMLSQINVANEMEVRFRTQPPSSFASSITGILFDNFMAIKDSMGTAGLALYTSAKTVATDELGVGMFAAMLPQNIVEAIMEDAEKIGGDKSYKIDIGV